MKYEISMRMASIVKRLFHSIIEKEVVTKVRERTKEIQDDYERRLNGLETELLQPSRKHIEELEDRLVALQEENQQLSERPTQDKLEELRSELTTQQQRYQLRVRELRSTTLKLLRSLPNPLQEIKSLRSASNLVVAPHENPLYMAFYFMRNTDRPTNTCYFLSRKEAFDILANLRQLKELTMLGFYASPENIPLLDRIVEGTITLVDWRKYNIPRTEQTQVIVYTPNEYLRSVRPQNEITRVSSLVRQVDSRNGESYEAKLILDALRLPIPLTQEVALSLGQHLAKGESLRNFRYLDELQERASYFTD